MYSRSSLFAFLLLLLSRQAFAESAELLGWYQGTVGESRSFVLRIVEIKKGAVSAIYTPFGDDQSNALDGTFNDDGTIVFHDPSESPEEYEPMQRITGTLTVALREGNLIGSLQEPGNRPATQVSLSKIYDVAGIYSGTINKTLNIQLQLNKVEPDGTVSGRYCYAKCEDENSLIGRIDPHGVFHLTEKSSDGSVAEWTGRIDGSTGQLDGEWSRLGTQKKLPIRLDRTNLSSRDLDFAFSSFGIETASKPERVFLSYDDEYEGIHFLYPANAEVLPCPQNADDTGCLLSIQPKSWRVCPNFHGLTGITLSVREQGYESTLKDAGFERDESGQLAVRTRFLPEPAQKLHMKEMKGVSAFFTCGYSDRETGFHAAAGDCFAAHIGTKTRSADFETQLNYLGAFSHESVEKIVKSFRFSIREKMKRKKVATRPLIEPQSAGKVDINGAWICARQEFMGIEFEFPKAWRWMSTRVTAGNGSLDRIEATRKEWGVCEESDELSIMAISLFRKPFELDTEQLNVFRNCPPKEIQGPGWTGELYSGLSCEAADEADGPLEKQKKFFSAAKILAKNEIVFLTSDSSSLQRETFERVVKSLRVLPEGPPRLDWLRPKEEAVITPAEQASSPAGGKS